MKICKQCHKEIEGYQNSVSMIRHWLGEAEEFNYHFSCFDNKIPPNPVQAEIIEKLNSIITEAIEADCPGNILETADDIKIALTKMWGEG